MAAGPDVELAIDLLYRWKDYNYARLQSESMAEFKLSWIEEPIPSEDVQGLRQLSEAISIPISGGECLATCAEFDEFMRESRPAIIQPDITRCGGISEMRRIYNRAAHYGTKFVPHGYSTGILLAATSQFLASMPHGNLIEYSESTSPLATSLVSNQIQLVEGKVKIGDLPGLGVSLDEKVIESYRIEVVVTR